MTRPAISVVVPFAGSRQSAEACVRAMAELRLREDDEGILADNSPNGVMDGISLPAGWRCIPAEGEGSPARARNAGALVARNPWVLFLDSDVLPPADLVERLFARPVDDGCAIVAGGVRDARGQRSLAAEHARTRQVLDQSDALGHGFLPYALTANLLVRRQAWRDLGGFLEGLANAEDVDFCWRAQRAGWTVQSALDATVEHVHREALRPLLRQHAVQRASALWVHRRWPEAALPPAPLVAPVGRALLAAPVFLVRGQPRRAALKVVDGLVAIAIAAGALRSNRPRRRPEPRGDGRHRRILVLCDEFPVVSETFVVEEARALAAVGHPVEVVAARRPERPRLGVHDVSVRYLEDDTRLERAKTLLRIGLRHPLRVLRDRRERGAWAAEEQVPGLRMVAPVADLLRRHPDAVCHAHFAKGAALVAMRASRLVGRPWSMTAHAYDIYKDPSNLEAKVADASLVTSGCDYTVRDLRAVAPGTGVQVQRIIMGVDPAAFRRTAPPSEEPVVLGVGRLVEKKGFVHLVRAIAEPPLAGTGARLVLAGDGPLREELAQEARRLGVAEAVELAGRREPPEVRALLERAAVLAMPCVVAADGDRDSMPVVVKEAMAMEVPVVVSDEVGLPELVRESFGRVVPPANPAALAEALAELLGLAPAQRAAMGRAGRAFVEAHANVHRETQRLSDLLQALR